MTHYTPLNWITLLGSLILQPAYANQHCYLEVSSFNSISLVVGYEQYSGVVGCEDTSYANFTLSGAKVGSLGLSFGGTNDGGADSAWDQAGVFTGVKKIRDLKGTYRGSSVGVSVLGGGQAASFIGDNANLHLALLRGGIEVNLSLNRLKLKLKSIQDTPRWDNALALKITSEAYLERHDSKTLAVVTPKITLTPEEEKTLRSAHDLDYRMMLVKLENEDQSPSDGNKVWDAGPLTLVDFKNKQDRMISLPSPMADNENYCLIIQKETLLTFGESHYFRAPASRAYCFEVLPNQHGIRLKSKVPEFIRGDDFYQVLAK